ncbi:hypothetical protein CMQ_8158 [Grosmannia clavigera kw1407]|uniref:Nephrocystin 3-like N-terminal domain-containing protein n=1 Tax=Grosmannia clavigera (strain kw1407 / UAMH 11150) TaxID=655863 RepID=F0XKI4_GROCL|nr:uncharacterized protein CMQ_8158 [Grosmannia clavigera kw1407]EFX01692.1 hypothetical protein CMQ_8158 [Grosmannia clavigera kw1407]
MCWHSASIEGGRPVGEFLSPLASRLSPPTPPEASAKGCQQRAVVWRFLANPRCLTSCTPAASMPNPGGNTMAAAHPSLGLLALCASHVPPPAAVWPKKKRRRQVTMEALAALSMACNVFQVLSFAHETFVLVRTIRQNGTPDPNLADRADQLAKLTAQLDSALQHASPVLQHTGAPALLGLAHKCSTASGEVQAELRTIASSRAGTVCKLVKTLARRGKLGRLEKKMHQHQQALLSRLLADVWNRQEAAAVQLQNGFTSLNADIKDFIQKFEQGQISTGQLLDAGNVGMLASLTANVDTVRQLIDSGKAEIQGHITAAAQTIQVARADEERLNKLRNSLRYGDINSRRTQIEKSQADTFSWVFEPDKSGKYHPFRDWLLSEKGLFWVNGKPGSGKSCFMKFLAQDNRTAELLPGHAIYSYFIWNSGSLMQRNRRGMFCSLLHQMLASNTYAAQILQASPRLSYKQESSDWELDELEMTLQSTLKLHTQPVCLFIDGLDELDRQDDNFDLQRLVRDTFTSVPGLKMCVSSRPEPLWTSLLHGVPSIRLQDLTRKDHKIVARELLIRYHQDPLKDESETTIQGLVDLLVEKAEGVFLWLRLALKSLQRGLTGSDSFHELQKRIDALPSELTSLYTSMWSRLGDDEATWRREAALYFHLVLQFPGDLAIKSNDGMSDGCEHMVPTTFYLALASDLKKATGS